MKKKSAYDVPVDIEQHGVRFADESAVKSCELCSKQFGLLLRKHHCWTCGKVRCANCVKDLIDGDPACSLCVEADKKA